MILMPLWMVLSFLAGVGGILAWQVRRVGKLARWQEAMIVESVTLLFYWFLIRIDPVIGVMVVVRMTFFSLYVLRRKGRQALTFFLCPFSILPCFGVHNDVVAFFDENRGGNIRSIF